MKTYALSKSQLVVAVAGVLALAFAASSCNSQSKATDTSDQPSVSATASNETQTPSATSTPSSSATSTVSSEVAEEQGRAFVSFAKSGKSEVQWAEEVSYLLAGVEVKVLSPTDASKPESWEGCIEGQDTFVEHECPVSALAVVGGSISEGGPVITTSVPKTVGCNRVTALQSWQTKTVAVIQAPETMSNCVDDFVVVIELSPTGAVEAVDLELTSP